MGKSRKKLLLSSLCMLIVAAIALSTATFAWFSTSTEGSVTGIEFTATSAQGILLSADAVNWKSVLPFSDVKTAMDITTVPTFVPVSTTGAVSGGKMSLFKGTLANNGTLTTTAATDNVEYLMFHIYAKNEGAQDQTLYLDLSSTVVDGTDAANKGTAQAVRIAFIDQGSDADATAAKAKNGGTTAVIWEPNANKHNPYAQASRYKVGSDGKPTDTKVGATGIENYVGISAAATELTVMQGAAIPADGKAALMSGVITGSTGTVKVANLPANKIAKLTVYLLIEGQDVDCNNAESAGTVITNLNFTITPAAS